jgi:hypothetical protein
MSDERITYRSTLAREKLRDYVCLAERRCDGTQAGQNARSTLDQPLGDQLVRMRLGSLLCALSCITLPASPARAQTPGSWEVQAELLRMDVKGFDEHAGDIVRATTVQAFNPPQITDTVTREPIDLDMGAKNTFRVSATYRGQQWGGGASFWLLRTSDSVSGHVSSSPPSLAASSVIMTADAVSMWRETLLPVTSDLASSGLSPMDFEASGRLRTFSLDLFATNTLAGSGDNGIDLILGAKVAKVETNQAQGFQERAFTFNFFGTGRHFNNNVSLNSVADADFTGVGPMVGFLGKTKWRRLRLEASTTESVVYGGTDQSGLFTDVDNITIAQGPNGPFLPCTPGLLLAGCASVRSDITFSTSEKTLVPVTEMRLKFLVDVSSSVSVGASGFGSFWSSTPVPPAFTVSHAGVGPGLDWEPQQRTLRFASIGAVLNVVF